MIEYDPDNVPIIYFQNGKRKNGVDSARAFLLFDEFQDYYNRRKTLKAKYPHLKEYRKRYKQHVLDKAEYKAKQNEIIKERQKLQDWKNAIENPSPAYVEALKTKPGYREYWRKAIFQQMPKYEERKKKNKQEEADFYNPAKNPLLVKNSRWKYSKHVDNYNDYDNMMSVLDSEDIYNILERRYNKGMYPMKYSYIWNAVVKVYGKVDDKLLDMLSNGEFSEKVEEIQEQYMTDSNGDSVNAGGEDVQKANEEINKLRQEIYEEYKDEIKDWHYKTRQFVLNKCHLE